MIGQNAFWGKTDDLGTFEARPWLQKLGTVWKREMLSLFSH
jgi:hypothetical protein